MTDFDSSPAGSSEVPSSISTSPQRRWWFFMCDDNHAWSIYLPLDDSPASTDALCPVDGAVAVTESPEEPSELVRISILPASSGRHNKDQYFLEISSPAGDVFLRSGRTFSWEEVLERIAWFRGQNWEDSRRRWERSRLDRADPCVSVPEPWREITLKGGESA